jgi:hypothetical protein
MIKAQMGTASVVLSPQNVTAGATVTANFDTRGSDYATLFIPRSAATATNATAATLSLLTSDNTNATTFVTVVADVTVQSTSAACHVYHVDMRGKKRYLRLSFSTGTHSTSAQVVSAVGYLTRKEEAPGTTTAMADTGVVVS